MGFLALLGLGVIGLGHCVKTGCERDHNRRLMPNRTPEEERERHLSNMKQIQIAHQVEVDYTVGKFVPPSKYKYHQFVREECLEECVRRVKEEGLEPNFYLIRISCNVY